MINALKFDEIESIQASLFVDGSSFSTSRILKTALDCCSVQFDGDPTVLPIPDDAPKDIPRIVLRKKDQSMRLEIAPIRLNLFRKKTKAEDEISPKRFLSEEAVVLGELIEKMGANCVRMAVVVQRVSHIKDPAKEIAIHFCKKNFIEEPFDRPSAFELHSLKKYTFLESFKVNSWVRIKSGIVEYEKGVLRPVMIAHQDINTWTELMGERKYEKSDISKFFENIFEEFDKILNLYFPGEN